jgi:hypothetical protein
MNAVNFNSTHSVSNPLLTSSISANTTHDFDNHLTAAVREGVDPSIPLAELADKTETDEQLQAMAASTFSRAVGRFLAVSALYIYKHPSDPSG